MPRGAYTAKQERKAEHIEEGYEKRGVSQEGSRRAAPGRRSTSRTRAARTPATGRSTQPQRRRQEGLGNPPPARQRLTARSRVRGFRSRVRSRAARCARAARASSRDRIRPAADWRAPRGPCRSGAAQGGGGCRVLSALDQAGADQGVDRAADRRRAAPDGFGDLVRASPARWRRSPPAACAGRARHARRARPRPSSARRLLNRAQAPPVMTPTS